MIRKIVSIFFLLLTVYKSGYSYVNVYPYRVYLDSEKNKNEETIVLYNKTVLPLRYKLSIKDKKLKKVVSFYPQVITLNPGDEKEIKLKLENNRENLEKKEIKDNVLKHEPHLALFVEDTNPLIFYDKISDLAQKNLNENGQLYFEINQYLGKEMTDLLTQKGFQNIILKEDLNENPRMIRGIRL